MNRPFTVRMPLGSAAAADLVAAAGDPLRPASDTLPLPEAWLAATRGGEKPSLAGRPTATVPVKSGASARRLEERLKAVSLDTSAAGTAADIDGFSLAAGDGAVRLVEHGVELHHLHAEQLAGGGRLLADEVALAKV